MLMNAISFINVVLNVITTFRQKRIFGSRLKEGLLKSIVPDCHYRNPLGRWTCRPSSLRSELCLQIKELFSLPSWRQLYFEPPQLAQIRYLLVE